MPRTPDLPVSPFDRLGDLQHQERERQDESDPDRPQPGQGLAAVAGSVTAGVAAQVEHGQAHGASF